MVWQMFEQNPARVQQVIALIGQFLDVNQDDAAVALARKLEQFQRRRGERRQFIAIMQDITAGHRASSQMLEFLSELYNASNRENEYCLTLLKLFDLYCSTGEYAKAAECLDRSAEVDPYEAGHLKRLDMLKGKVDDARFKLIASRFSPMTKPAEEPSHQEAPTLGASTLQDLMLQAEILVQYGMRNKAVERLQRIQEMFPREEERNEDLQRLYLAAGITPRYAGSAPLPPAPAPVPGITPAAAPAAAQVADPAADVRSFTRVAEITRKLYHQGTAKAVLTTAVKEIGGHWETTRCVVAMAKPGLPADRAGRVLRRGTQGREHVDAGETDCLRAGSGSGTGGVDRSGCGESASVANRAEVDYGTRCGFAAGHSFDRRRRAGRRVAADALQAAGLAAV